jgi:hypothetical protein
MSEEDLSPFEKKLAERRIAREAAARKQQEQQVKHDEDLVPSDPYTRSDADMEMDRIIDAVDIIDGYVRWCGKMRPDPKGKTESIMISCPKPTHADKKPSAWINTDKQTWYCGACSEGGDVLDIAAYHFGYPVPGYKEGARFHELRRDMAKDLGYTFTTLPGDVTVISGPAAGEDGVVLDPEPTSNDGEVNSDNGEDGTSGDETSSAQVIDLYEDLEDDIAYPSLDWRSVIPEETYLRAYMDAACVDDVPEEYHFWNALLGLGFALGRDVRLFDFVPVYGNLFVCTLGRSGAGKSKARGHLDRLLAQAMPHDWSDPHSKGVRKVASPGSAEVLIHNFQKPVMDLTNPKVVAFYAPVRGMIDFNELSSLIARTSRQGNATIPTLMQFYDMEPMVATSSMTHGAKEAHEPFASVLTTTQPRALRNLITKADDASGFLNRWVFAPGKEKQRFAIGGVQVDMEPVIPYLQSLIGWAGSFKSDEMIGWEPDAAERFTDFFHKRVEIDKKKSDTDLIIRIDLLLKKLILLFTANRKERKASLRSVEDAIACYDYLIAAYKIPAGQIGNTLGNEISEAIMGIVSKQYNLDKKGVTLNQIAKSLKRRKYPHDMLLKTADGLVKLGFLTVEATKTGSVGRPTTRYKRAE